VVLATAGGSPGWLIGPLHFAGSQSVATSASAGAFLYAALWVLLGLYVLCLARAKDLTLRLATAAVVCLHVLFFLAPPFLSQDVFSYIAYARMGAIYGLSPYTASPLAIPGDAVFAFAGSKQAPSVYGPLFTLLAYPFGWLSVPIAYWLLKTAAVACSLTCVYLVAKVCKQLGRNQVRAVLCVGANPLVLIHVVSAAHNEALVGAITLLGLFWFVRQKPTLSGASVAVASAIKLSASVLLFFFLAAGLAANTQRGRLRGIARPLAGAVLAAASCVAASALVLSNSWVDGVAALSANQAHTSRLSLPAVLAKLLSVLGGQPASDYITTVRAGLLVLLVCGCLWLAAKTIRGADVATMAGWATLFVLCTSAWLVPWYVMWVIPLVAVSTSKRLMACSLLLCGWMLAIAIPF
jgi:alpha-1,6-mannosyltransferase